VHLILNHEKENTKKKIGQGSAPTHQIDKKGSGKDQSKERKDKQTSFKKKEPGRIKVLERTHNFENSLLVF
jgi:hypothetical protein